MKKFFLFFSLLACLGALGQVERYIPDPPRPPRLVNDFADLLSPADEARLEQKLDRYDDSTSSQIAVVTVTDLHDYSAVEYAVALGRKWGVGGSKFNNGIVVLVSTGGGDGNRDAFIATGYGLEGAIPDITANAILETALIPYLRSGDYFAGFDSSTNALIHAAAGEYKAPPGYRKGAKGDGGKGPGGFIIILIIIFILVSMFRGGGGGRGGGFMSRRGYRGFWGPTIFGGLGGGGFGSSGGGFGGGGGGGFGGFGGGGFGGGGAGGKW